MRWHPLPTDEQVAAAIEDRKAKFISHYKMHKDGREWRAEDEMGFNHICIVLDHAMKIFQISEEELLDPNAHECFKDGNGS